MKNRTSLYSSQQIRQLEQMAINELGVSEAELMHRAGASAFNTLKNYFQTVQSIAVFCGGGNNGGDGYVLARLAHEQGLSVQVYYAKAPDTLPSCAREAASLAIKAGVSCYPLPDTLDNEVELLVDALLGIGLKGKVHGPIKRIISVMNESGLPVLSLDVPSGLDADTGVKCGECVQADITTTFIAFKKGFYTADAPDYCGEIICHDLGLNNNVTSLDSGVYRFEAPERAKMLPPRAKNAYKSMFGHILVVGGGPGMPGAAYLAAKAALRTGAGMVTLASHPSHAKSVLPGLPEAMIHGVGQGNDLQPLLQKATVCIIGPGLGESEWAELVFKTAVSAHIPLLIDASGLHLLAKYPQQNDNWVLTPHPGEAARLLACSVTEIQNDRFKAAALLQQKYHGQVVLKGAGTIIHSSLSDAYVCTNGNPGMASAGMGDVLSGVIGGLIAQGLSLQDAAKFGVWAHAKAGDEAAAIAGERGLLASDLFSYVQRQVNIYM